MVVSSLAKGAVLTVTSTNDAGPGSLRQMVNDALSGDIINFSLVYPATITLNTEIAIIGKNLTIDGPGVSNLSIDGGLATRLFYVENSSFNMNNLSLNNAFTSSYGSAVYAWMCNVSMSDLTVDGNSSGEGAIYLEESTGTLSDLYFSNNVANWGGAALDFYYSQFTVSNCTFDSNSASDGGAFLSYFSSYVFDNCVFEFNSGNNGGAIASYNDAASQITNSNFLLNTSTASGGAIYVRNNSSILEIQSSIFENNSALNGGAIYNYNCTLELSDSDFIGNQATNSGGALYGFMNSINTINSSNLENNVAQTSEGGAIYLRNSNNTLNISNSNILNNSAVYKGGGVFVDEFNASLDINNSVFSGNITSDPTSRGGGVYVWSVTQVQISNSNFNNNNAGYGGGLYINECNLNMSNSSVYNNTALVDGGGMHLITWGTITSSTISGNNANVGGAMLMGIYDLNLNSLTISGNTTTTGADIRDFGSASHTIKNSILDCSFEQTSPGVITSLGNNVCSNTSMSAFLIQPSDLNNTDPMLGPLQNNGGATLTHAPLCGSPCINTGAVDAPTFDQIGNARDGQADRGAYEFQTIIIDVTAQPIATTVCKNASSQFEVSATGVDSYEWQESTDGGSNWMSLSDNATYSNTSTSNLTITSSAPGMNGNLYRCILTGQCGTLLTSDEVLLSIQQIDVTTSLSGITISANESNATSYQWITCSDNLPISGEIGQSFTPIANGSYAVIINKDGCQDTSECVLINDVGITETTAYFNTAVYPNPVTDVFVISLGEHVEELTYSVYDMNGKKILEGSALNVQKLKVPFDAMSGVYILDIRSNDHLLAKVRIVKN